LAGAAIAAAARPAPGTTDTVLEVLRAAGAGGGDDCIEWPSIRMSWPQRRHFMRSVRPVTFSSAI
jgi:hypothetical protein